MTGERVWEQPWPEADPALLSRDTFTLVVQVNGKLRDRVEATSTPARTSCCGSRARASACASTSTASRSSRRSSSPASS